jgi:hypothetical protein
MQEHNSPGTVINVASMGGFFPMEIAPVYAATKAGVIHYTRCLPFAVFSISCLSSFLRSPSSLFHLLRLPLRSRTPPGPFFRLACLPPRKLSRASSLACSALQALAQPCPDSFFFKIWAAQRQSSTARGIRTGVWHVRLFTAAEQETELDATRFECCSQIFVERKRRISRAPNPSCPVGSAPTIQ